MDQLSLTQPEDPPNVSGVESEYDDYDDVKALPYRAESRTVKKDDPPRLTASVPRHAQLTSCRRKSWRLAAKVVMLGSW